MKKKEITGHSYYRKDDDYQILIIPSGTRDYFHVIIDSAYDGDNHYFHQTKEEIERDFEGVKI